jgi:SNF2 family DNA or RNA helicase
MISPYAVKEFLKRKLISYTWLKQQPEAELDKSIAALWKLRSPLRFHQKVCFLAAIAEPCFGLFLEMGLGKTLLVLELIQYWRAQGQCERVLVLVPTDEIAYAWELQILEWFPKLPYVILTGSTIDKVEGFDREKLITVVSYPGLLYMACMKRYNAKRKRNEMVPDNKKVVRLASGIDMVVADESYHLSNPGSLTWWVVTKFVKAIPIRYALSGRPFGRDPFALWGQFYFMDEGDTLGDSQGLFREAFFSKKAKFFGGPFSFDYTFKKKMENDLARMVAHRSMQYRADECIQLPERMVLRKYFKLPGDALGYYAKLRERLRNARGDFTETKLTFMLMRQLSSGFMGYTDAETDERAQVSLDTNPKLELCLELIDEMADSDKVVIFYEFTYSARLLTARFNKLKLAYGWLWSGTKDTQSILKKFNSPSGLQVLLVQSRVGSEGLNLQAARNVIFYESPVSAVVRDQAEHRCWRQGQKRKVFQYDLVARNTVDERILDFHATGNDIYRAVMADPSLIDAKPRLAPSPRRKVA